MNTLYCFHGPNAIWAGMWDGDYIGFKYLYLKNISINGIIKKKRILGLTKMDNPDDFVDFYVEEEEPK